jgi:hypothetical protein
MSGCWTDGELRAYVDRELPEGDRVAAHLDQCAACSARHTAIAERAIRVSALMGGLSGEGNVVRLKSGQVRNEVRRKAPVWVGVAVSLAAALAAGFVIMPRSRPAAHLRPAHVDQPVLRAQVGIGLPAPGAQTLGTRHVMPPRARPHTVANRPKTAENVKYFLALDDEPIDTGMMMRVALGDENVQADVIVGSDGRARAVRLVN